MTRDAGGNAGGEPMSRGKDALTCDEHGVTRRQFVGLGMASVGVFALGDVAEAAAEEQYSEQPSKQRVTLSWRVQRSSWVPDRAFGPLIALLSKHRAVVDEVCLFDSPGFAFFPPLEY